MAIQYCGCRISGPATEYQNRTYGLGNRVMNDCKPNQQVPKMVRCTICGKEHAKKG